LSSTRRLIVNADDFGRSAGINAGILRAHVDGIVTSASLMVRWPAAAEAARGRSSRLSVGLHLDLGEWAYVQGGWEPVYQVVRIDDAAAVGREVRSQLDRFRELMGCDPTHIDSHQHVHRNGIVAEAVDALARPLGLPVRQRHELISYCGDFYGRTGHGEPLHDAITPQRLIAILRALPSGTTELACHPGLDDGADPFYDEERPLELRALCDAGVRAVIAADGIELQSFAGLSIRERLERD
jgi:predicted glycoside hydrolase/deacetylase ChbG (UPF0249 family)